MNDKHCFELYGFDVLFDDSFKVYVIEVNASPSMSANTPEDQELKTNLLSSVFDIVDVEGNMTGEEVRVGGFDLVQKGGGINLQGNATESVNNSSSNNNNNDKSSKNKKDNDNSSSSNSSSHGINLGGTGGSPTVNSYSTMLGCDIPKEHIVRSPLANQHITTGSGYTSKRNSNNNSSNNNDDDNDRSSNNNNNRRNSNLGNNNNNDRSATPSNERATSSNSYDKNNDGGGGGGGRRATTSSRQIIV